MSSPIFLILFLSNSRMTIIYYGKPKLFHIFAARIFLGLLMALTVLLLLLCLIHFLLILNSLNGLNMISSFTVLLSPPCLSNSFLKLLVAPLPVSFWVIFSPLTPVFNNILQLLRPLSTSPLISFPTLSQIVVVAVVVAPPGVDFSLVFTAEVVLFEVVVYHYHLLYFHARTPLVKFVAKLVTPLSTVIIATTQPIRLFIQLCMQSEKSWQLQTTKQITTTIYGMITAIYQAY
ncbi:hypothetical protein Dimus_037805 [Dionaea muscipula]